MLQKPHPQDILNSHVYCRIVSLWAISSTENIPNTEQLNDTLTALGLEWYIDFTTSLWKPGLSSFRSLRQTHRGKWCRAMWCTRPIFRLTGPRKLTDKCPIPVAQLIHITAQDPEQATSIIQDSVNMPFRFCSQHQYIIYDHRIPWAWLGESKAEIRIKRQRSALFCVHGN